MWFIHRWLNHNFFKAGTKHDSLLSHPLMEHPKMEKAVLDYSYVNKSVLPLLRMKWILTNCPPPLKQVWQNFEHLIIKNRKLHNFFTHVQEQKRPGSFPPIPLVNSSISKQCFLPPTKNLDFFRENLHKNNAHTHKKTWICLQKQKQNPNYLKMDKTPHNLT